MDSGCLNSQKQAFLNSKKKISLIWICVHTCIKIHTDWHIDLMETNRDVNGIHMSVFSIAVEGCEWWPSLIPLEDKVCQVSERWHTQHVYLKKLREDLSNMSSFLIHLRRSQSSQSHQQRFGGSKCCFDDCPDQTQEVHLLPYQQCIFVTKHNLEDDSSSVVH